MGYRIIITNYGGSQILDKVYYAETENLAIKQCLETEYICSGDKITIEEE